MDNRFRRSFVSAFVFVLALASPLIARAQSSLPAEWSVGDVGAPAIAGYATDTNQVFTVSGAGRGIRGTADQFTLASRAMVGDGTIVAYLSHFANVPTTAEAGLAIRQGLGARMAMASLTVTPSNEVVFKRRRGANEALVSTTATVPSARVWLRLQRHGTSITASWSADGTAWTTIGHDNVSMFNTLEYGLAVSSGLDVAPALASFTSVQARSVVESGAPLPAGWQTQDIGAPSRPGVAVADGSTFALSGGGSGTSAVDQLRYAYVATANRNLDIVVRVRDLGDTDPWSKAGIMIRESLSASGAHASLFVTPGNGTLFSYRALPGGATAAQAGSALTSPTWLMLSLRGGVVTASQSTDGAGWTTVGSTTLPVAATVYVGLAVTSGDDEGTVVANIDHVQITASSPAGTPDDRTEAAADARAMMTDPASSAQATAVSAVWTADDVGSPATTGSTTLSNGVYTIRGGGANIWGTSDQFHFVYQQMSGDMDVVARVQSVTNANPWSKAGVMIRETLNGNSRYAGMFVAAANPLAFQRRTATGGTTTTTNVSGAAPMWVKLSRRGNVLTASTSPNGTTWTTIGTQTIALPAQVFVGVAVASVTATGTTTAVVDNLTATSTANQPPTVTLAAPASGAVAPATITLTATAADADGTVAKVDFYQGSTLIGSDTSSPYNATWSNVAAGSYTLTARATDNTGATTTSSAVAVTVSAPSNQPPVVSLTSPASGATFTVPASITISANAGDANGSVAKVDFYAGSTLIATDTSSPYTATWSNVAAGTHTLTARATDNGGVTTMSGGITVTVSAAGLPSGWTAADIGNPAMAGATTHSSGTYTIQAGGADIWGTSDQFRFVYRQMSGDMDVVTRVQSLTRSHDWAKAGVMIRASLAADAAYAGMFVSAAKPAAFQRRTTAGGTSAMTQASASAPVFVRVSRRGNLITAAWSSNGSNWTTVGTETIAMPSSVYVGIAAASLSTTTTTTVIVDNLAATSPTSNQPPTVSLTAPAGGAAFTAPASITLSAAASDADGTISRVEFYQGSTLIGTDTTSPYSVSWSNVAAATYAIAARAYDNMGAMTTSASVSVTVSAAASTQRNAIFSPSAQHSTTVTSYVLEIFAAGVNTATATPLATRDLGRPAIVNGECTADISAALSGLPAGTYQATVAAVSASGRSPRSAPTSFTR